MTESERRKLHRTARHDAGAPSHVPVGTVDGKHFRPRYTGRKGYWITPNGSICHYPSAYRRHYGRPQYVQSTCRVEISRDYEAAQLARMRLTGIVKFRPVAVRALAA